LGFVFGNWQDCEVRFDARAEKRFDACAEGLLDFDSLVCGKIVPFSIVVCSN
jgi:hypothetical protein